ncbi:tail terminator [Gordonia phage Francois]|nr:tail terminator [Gordonia phage Francois]
MVRVLADPMPRVRAWLTDNLVEAEVRADVPPNWTLAAATRPLVVVADDGGPVDWPVRSEHTIRLVARAKSRTEARTTVRLAAGRLHTAKLNGIVVRRAGGSVIESTDKATGAYLASVLVPIQARTVEL